MAPEIVRKLIGGQWRTVEENAGGGGGSTPGAIRWLGPCKINAFSAQELPGASNGTADGGTYTISYGATETDPLAFDASAATIQAAIEALDPTFVGKVTVAYQFTPDVNNVIYINFDETVAAAVLTADGTGLTGPDAPYTITPDTNGRAFFAMLTPAVGDIVEDFLHAVIAAFDGGARLFYTDSLATPEAGAPVWSNPATWSGVDGLDITVDTEYDNFYGSGAAGSQSKPTPSLAMINAPVEAAGTDMYANLPAVVRVSVPVYTYLRYDDAPTMGEVWIWVKTATPAEVS